MPDAMPKTSRRIRGQALLPLIGLALVMLAMGVAIGFLIGRQPLDPALPERSPDPDALAVYEPPEAESREPEPDPEPEPDKGEEPTARNRGDDISDEDWEWMLEALEDEKLRRRLAEFSDDDTGGDTLRKILEHGSDPRPLFEGFDRFKKPLEKRTAEETVIRVTPDNIDSVIRDTMRGKELAENTVFVFGPGEYAFRGYFRLSNVSQVTLSGAGMDATTLKPQSTLVMADGVDHVTIEGLTIDGTERSDGILDARGAGAYLIRRVRTLGFDAGAGYSSAIGVGAGTYVACEGCEFLGGYGRSPLDGYAVSLRERGFVYFYDCTFTELESFLRGSTRVADGSFVKAERCRSIASQRIAYFDPGVTLALVDTTFEGLVYDEPPKGTVIDLGGNSFAKADPDRLPSLVDVIDQLESLGTFTLESIEIEESRSRQRLDASYTKVRRIGDVAVRELNYYTAPGASPAERRSHRTFPLGPLHKKILGASIVPMSHAARIAMDSFTGGGRPRLESIQLGEAQDRLVYVAKLNRTEVRIDAATGVPIED